MRVLLSVPLALAVACAATPPTEPATPTPPPPPATSPAPPPDAGAPPVAADAGAVESVASGDAGEEAAEGPSSCPEGMVLVEGDYCTEVEQKCDSELVRAVEQEDGVREIRAAQPAAWASACKKRFCIDNYSWPNKKGERPEVMNNFYQAQVKCAAVGKRMCTESRVDLRLRGPGDEALPLRLRAGPQTSATGTAPGITPT